MQVAFPELDMPATVMLSPEGVSDDDYFAFCEANPELRLERTAEGAILIVPPAGLESSHRNNKVSRQLDVWASRDKRGKAFDSSAEFFLPNGAARSPDASWISNARLQTLPKSEKRKFPHLCPEFVVEVMSPSDRLKAAQAKMQEWVDNGVELGWLIDGDARTVYIYRAGKTVEKRSKISKLAGDGPVAGFVLKLDEIWAGL
jgi:Uma2 family endonuclease